VRVKEGRASGSPESFITFISGYRTQSLAVGPDIQTDGLRSRRASVPNKQPSSTRPNHCTVARQLLRRNPILDMTHVSPELANRAEYLRISRPTSMGVEISVHEPNTISSGALEDPKKTNRKDLRRSPSADSSPPG
jgi:hypothetical protein